MKYVNGFGFTKKIVFLGVQLIYVLVHIKFDKNYSLSFSGLLLNKQLTYMTRTIWQHSVHNLVLATVMTLANLLKAGKIVLIYFEIVSLTWQR
jgi:hypothetical protein